MAYGIAAEPNQQNFRLWNSDGHVTTLPMAIKDVEILVDQFFAVLWVNDTSVKSD